MHRLKEGDIVRDNILALVHKVGKIALLYMSLQNPTREIVTTVKKTKGNLYLIKLVVSGRCFAATGVRDDNWTWHKRYGHLKFHSLKSISGRELAHGVPKIDLPGAACLDNLVGKLSRAPFPIASSYRATQPLELLHMDLCGPTTPTTLGGRSYFLLIVNDYFRLMWISLLKQK